MARLVEELVGETLSDRYRLVSRLSTGGMGEVYRGHDLLLDRAVAVKVLQPSLASDPELVDRFKDEARAAARLTHPNVVAVYDWGAADERTYYMVMEYVAGNDLRDILVARGSLEPSQAAEIIASVCDALAAAHAGGLVHRDVKPENVLIARDGTVKVADFGIAAVADADRTAPGQGIQGTLRYLAPEQAQGHEATWASDVWAAGAVLSELLTGLPPSARAGADLIQRRASERPVPPSRLAPGVSPSLDDIVVEACALDPGERFPDASFMAHALRRVATRALPDAPALDGLVNDLTGEIRIASGEGERLQGRRARKRRHRRKGRVRRALARLLRGVAIVVVLALVALGGARAAPFLFGPAAVDVPRLRGMRLSEATRRAELLGLEARVVERRRTLSSPRGHVVAQSPIDGSVSEGSTLGLVVSAGPPLQQVPSLVGKPRAEAVSALRASGLVAGDGGRRYSGAPKGTVVAQDPAGGLVEQGDEIRLTVSKGRRPIDIPEIAGLSPQRATKRLRAAGFRLTRRLAYSDDVPEGRAVATSPEGRLPPGSELELIISRGPRFEEVELVDVRGLGVHAAQRRLEGLGLRTRTVDSCNGGSVVVETDPIAGTTVRENDLVALFLC